MNELLLTFYGDDFTGSTDALEQLTLAGVRTVLFIRPPTPTQLARFKGLQAVGVAGMTRSLSPAGIDRELRSALRKLQVLGARHVHYKVCSTFDSSPGIGSIGRAIDIGAEIFRRPFVPVLAAAPALGRYTVFGTHFARYGIGSEGAIFRLDRHPSISKHPVTPMTEAHLGVHLSKQTTKSIALFDMLNVSLPIDQARKAFRKLLRRKPGVVLFDALHPQDLEIIGRLLNDYATASRPLFSVESSGIEAALAGHLAKPQAMSQTKSLPDGGLEPSPLLVGSGSCSPVTTTQIQWALRRGFREVPLEAASLALIRTARPEILRATKAAVEFLESGHGVIIHTTRMGPDQRLAARLGHRTSSVLGTALGTVLRGVLERTSIRRLCLAGGDTASHAARALGIEAVEMIAPLTPGAPLCRVTAPGSTAEGTEMVFKGGQVGAEDYFGRVEKGTK